MSHVVVVKAVFTDLEALERAAPKCGMRLVRGQKTWRWVGRWFNDYHAQDAAYLNDIPVEDYGKCEHALVLEGAHAGDFEVGLARNPRGPGWVPVYDYVASGRTIRDRIGAHGERLKQEYAVACLTLTAARQFDEVVVSERLPNGHVHLAVARARCG